MENLRGRFQAMDPEGLRYGAQVSVWMRWCILAICLVGSNYRVDVGTASHLVATLYVLFLMSANAYGHLRLRANQPLAIPWLLVLSVLDLALISMLVSFSGGLESNYFILYYLALGMIVVATACLWLSCAIATAVAAVYSGLTLYFGSGINLSSQDERTLAIRIVALYGFVTLVHLVLGFERMRNMVSLRRERESALHRQQVEFSQVIHDTTAQSAYMIGLGIETAIELSDKSNRKLVESLQATYTLSKSSLWELRHHIDIGPIFEGRELVGVLRSHAGIFASITSVPAEVTVNGEEPPLPTSTRSGLFSIAHNAMTNAFRHASPSRVDISLDFQPDLICLAISDDGIGLPANYAERGHGFRNMRGYAESVGGKLEVKTGGSEGGTVISCLIPYETNPGG